MSWFSHNSDEKNSYDTYHANKDNEHHKAHLSYDVIAGAASYEAAKKWEEHEAANGKPESHAKAKEVVAGAIAAFLTQEVQTKGLDWWDEHKKEQLQREAQTQAEAKLKHVENYE